MSQQITSFFKNFYNSKSEIEFDKNKVLGIGNAVVFEGFYNGLPVAVKRITVELLPKEDREVITQVRLDHENVLKILAVEQDADFRYIALELCAGTLADVCNEINQLPDLPSDGTVLTQIATGLNYIHSQKLIHRDIKPENILISLDATKDHHAGRIKISDFGLCKETSPNHTYEVSGPHKGTEIWMAQELLKVPDDSPTPIKGSIKSDIFSAGCVFFFFLTRGIHPFGKEKLIVGNIVNGIPVNFYESLKSNFSINVIYIIRQMLRHQPNERIDLEQVLQQLKYLQTLQPGNKVATTNRQTNHQSNILIQKRAFNVWLYISGWLLVTGFWLYCLRCSPCRPFLFRFYVQQQYVKDQREEQTF